MSLSFLKRSGALLLPFFLVTSSYAQTTVAPLADEGGRSSGGGEVDIGPEYLKIAKNLSRGLEALSTPAQSPTMKDIANRIDSILAAGIQILPTTQPLVWKEDNSDELGTLVDALTVIGKRKTYIYSPNWMRRSCEKRHILALHEFLVHEKLESSLTLNVTENLWAQLKAAKEAKKIDIDFSCDERTLPDAHIDFTVAVVNNRAGERISIECVASDQDHRCTTYQFFYSPKQQDLKTPIGGRVYNVQELAKLSVVDWNKEKWKDVPLFIFDDARLMLSATFGVGGGIGLGLQLNGEFTGFERWADKAQSKKAQALLEAMTTNELLGTDATNTVFRQMKAGNGTFNKLVEYISHEGEIDMYQLKSLNQTIRFLKTEFSKVKCVNAEFGKGNYAHQTKVCALITDVSNQGFTVVKPQSVTKSELSSGIGYRPGSGNQRKKICEAFGKTLNLETRGNKVTEIVQATYFYAPDNVQVGVNMGGATSRAIGKLECYAR